MDNKSGDKCGWYMKDKLAYLAGLFDGEGCVTYKKYWDVKRKDRPKINGVILWSDL